MLTNSGKSPTLALQLVKCLWETLLSLDGTEMQTIIKVISEPSQVIFIATEVGNFEVLAELVRSCPELMWEVDTKNRSIIHIAALHRHIDIYNLIHETSSIRNFVVTLEDEDKNNLLHYAAKLSPPSKLNLLPGPVLQMKFELMWYEEVKKIMQPCFIEMRNSNGKTPRELFTEEHLELVTKAESWMKSMINSCITISTVTATLVLATAFSIKQEDFLKSLLRKIWWGLVTLYTSIAYLSTTFTIAFFTTYQVRVPKSFFWGPLISLLIMEYLLFPYGSLVNINPRYWLPSKYIFYTGKAKGRVN
uniref:PGG domain-containing protein n=1 Tax=Glycine max TaxID=3847 RepID=A0A0R0IB51_SOYBN